MTCNCECDPHEVWRQFSHKDYDEMTSIQRISFLRSLRLFIIEEKRKYESDKRFKEYLWEEFMKKSE